jgi:hypothetical protein
VLDRLDRTPPTHHKSGRPVFDTLYGRPATTDLDDAHLARIEEMNRGSRRIARALRHPVMTIENYQQRRRTRRRAGAPADR